ncbi:MAG: hypothetical protein Q8J88_12570 [Bacteroidales bacterium]|nr:hypothetical protein [Bacteroidales bacterium]
MYHQSDSAMLIIADSRMPQKAMENLQNIAEVLQLEPQNSVYPSIAAHPDIFFCQTNYILVTAPEIPSHWIKILLKHNVSLSFGNKKLSSSYPDTATYNAVATGKTLIHNLQITDKFLLEMFDPTDRIHVEQGYARCNLLALNDQNYITSDLGIQKKLQTAGKNVLFVNPRQVTLPGQKHGFFPGACGISNDTLYVCGDTNFLDEAKAIQAFIKNCGFKLVHLCDSRPTDVGSIFFIE